METLLTVWSADRIKEAWQRGVKPVVVKLGLDYIDLTFKGLARIEGNHVVEDNKYELVVVGKGKHFRKRNFH